MFSRLSIGLWSLDASGYWNNTGEGTVKKLEAAAKIKVLRGVELIYPTHVNEENLTAVKDACRRLSLEVVSVNPNVWADPIFARGAFTSRSAAARKKAVEYGKTAFDFAKELGAGRMCLWPGQDGFDYPFQDDYSALWDLSLEGIGEVARYAKGHKIGIEYKFHEPRGQSLLDSASTVLLLSRMLGLDNVGINLDFGHALLSKENPGESVVKCMREGKLFGVHVNDNYGATDEDMTLASIHHVAPLEFFYYLNKTGYDGWISLDIAPRREDPISACELSFRNLARLEKAVERLDIARLKEAQASSDSLLAQEIVNCAIFGA
jgi:xylose isomerase